MPSTEPPKSALVPPVRAPLIELLYLAAPTVAQMASYTVMQFIDTWMLSHLGVNEPAAASNAGILSFAVISLGFGAMLVVNTLVSQGYGAKDYVSCGRWMWQGIWMSLLYGLIVLPLLPSMPKLFLALGHERAFAFSEASYIRIVLGASVLKLIGTALGQFLLAVNRPNSVLLSAMVGVSVNAVAAWILIFGNSRLAPMGIRGAAWAQNIGVAVEVLVLIAMVCRRQVRGIYNLTDWTFRGKMFRRLLALGLPAGVQIVADVLAWSMFAMWVMGRFGTSAMAANTFVFRYMSVSFMPAWGISQAVTALVGRYIGSGMPQVAADRTWLGFKVCATYMITCGIAFFFLRAPLMHLFTKDPRVFQIGSSMLILAAIYQFFDAMYIVYNGALRGAGDTFIPAIVTATLCWSITVLGGYLIAVSFPALGPSAPWGVATFYGGLVGLFTLLRFRARGWQRKLTIATPASDQGFAIPNALGTPV